MNADRAARWRSIASASERRRSAGRRLAARSSRSRSTRRRRSRSPTGCVAGRASGPARDRGRRRPRPTRTARWTWGELDAEADQAATLLLAPRRASRASRSPTSCRTGREFVVLTLATLRIGAVCCPLMPIFRRARDALHALRRAQARVLVVPERFRGRDAPGRDRRSLLAGRGSGLRRSSTCSCRAAGEQRRLPSPHRHALARPRDGGERSWPTPSRVAARAPSPTRSPSCCSPPAPPASPRASLHRHDALTRAAAMEVEHLGLGRRRRHLHPLAARPPDRVPLRHVAGVRARRRRRSLQAVWDAERAPATALRALRRHLRAGRDAVPGRPGRGSSRSGEPRRRAAAHLRRHRRRGAARRWPSAPRAVLGTAVCGAWGTTETCLGTLAAPGDPPAKRLGHRRARAAGDPAAHRRRRGHRCSAPARRATSRSSADCLFDGYLDRPDLTAEALTRRRLVPDGRPRPRSTTTATCGSPAGSRTSSTGAARRSRSPRSSSCCIAHPAVEDVAIVAMPDPRLGERACAFVVLATPAQLDLDAMQELPGRRTRVAKHLLARAARARRRASAQRRRQDPEVRAARARRRAAKPSTAEGRPSDDAAPPPLGRSTRGVRCAEGRDRAPTSRTRASVGASASSASAPCRSSCGTSCATAATCALAAPVRVRRPRHPVPALPRAARALLDVARVAADDRPRRQRHLARRWTRTRRRAARALRDAAGHRARSRSPSR